MSPAAKKRFLRWNKNRKLQGKRHNRDHFSRFQTEMECSAGFTLFNIFDCSAYSENRFIYLGKLTRLNTLKLHQRDYHLEIFLSNYEDPEVFDLGTCLQRIKMRGRSVGVCGHTRKENNSYFIRSDYTAAGVVISYIKAHKWYLVKHATGTGILCQYHEIDHCAAPGKF